MRAFILCIVTFMNMLQGAPKVVALFGDHECPWSEQLKTEVWNNSSFQALLEAAGIEREEKIGASFHESVPFFILLSSKGEEIGRLGYLLISAEKYVDLFKDMLAIDTVCRSLPDLSVVTMLELYRKSQVFHMAQCQETLLKEGLKKDTGVEFLLEYYANMSKEHPRRAQKIKAEIRNRQANDPAVEWELALLSFQAKRERNLKESRIVHPLEKFLRAYGSKEKEYAWRCHLVLSEFYRDKNKVSQAERYAQLAAEDAPLEIREMLHHVGEKTL